MCHAWLGEVSSRNPVGIGNRPWEGAKQEEEEMLMNLIMSDAGLPGGGDSKYNNNKSIIREYQTSLFGSLFYLFGIFHRLHVLLYFIFRSVVQKVDDSTLLEHR